MREAQALTAAGEYSGAYYLAGYAIECALKACIAKQFREYDFPDKQTVLDSYSHDPSQLARVAKLDVKAQSQTDMLFATNWTTVKDWSEKARYRIWTADQAQQLLEAITDQKGGIMRWLRLHW